MGINVSFYIASSQPEASSFYAGALLFNSTTKKISRCKDDGSAWEAYGGGDCNVIVKTDTGDYASNQQQGILYVNTYDKTLKLWNGSSWVTVAKAPVTSVRASGSATDTEIPTEKAVRDAIDDLFSGGKIKSSILPAVALSEYKGAVDTVNDTSNSQTALTGLTAEIGDFATVTNDGAYVLTNTPASTASNWVKITATDTNTWRKIKVDGTEKLGNANSTGDIDFVGGTNVSLSYSSNALTIAATDTTYSEGTGIEIDSANSNAISVKIASSNNMLTTNGSGELIVSNATAVASTSGTGGSNGLMSAADKEKLNGLSVLEWQTVSNS